MTKFGFVKIISAFLLFSMIFSSPAVAASADTYNYGYIEVVPPDNEDSIFLDARDISVGIKDKSDASAYIITTNGVPVLQLSVTSNSENPYVVIDVGENIKSYNYITLITKTNVTGAGFSISLGAKGGDYGKKLTEGLRYASVERWQALTSEIGLERDIDGRIKINFFEGYTFPAESTCYIFCLIFSKTAEGARSGAIEVFDWVYSAVQSFSDFDELEVGYFNQGSNQSNVGVVNGNIVYESTGDANGSDPFSMWVYKMFAEHRGERVLRAEDFNYIVIRYKSRNQRTDLSKFEIFYQTGDRTAAVWNCARSTKYVPSDDWGCLTVDFTDAAEWSGVINSLRIDWVNSLPEGTYGRFEISNILFFKNKDDAKNYVISVNSINVPDPQISEQGTGEGDGTEEVETKETEDIVLPWETETETLEQTTEETLPEYIEDSTEHKEESTEESSESDVGGTETESDKDSYKPSGDIDIDPTEPSVKDEGSQMPFAIACSILALLSIASIASVIVIRAKEKKSK